MVARPSTTAGANAFSRKSSGNERFSGFVFHLFFFFFHFVLSFSVWEMTRLTHINTMSMSLHYCFYLPLNRYNNNSKLPPFCHRLHPISLLIYSWRHWQTTSWTQSAISVTLYLLFIELLLRFIREPIGPVGRASNWGIKSFVETKENNGAFDHPKPMIRNHYP